jgi:hypothetical protein
VDSDCLISPALYSQYSRGYATADHGQVDAGCIRIENGELRMEKGGGDRRIKEVLSYRETNNRVNYDRRTERNILRKPSVLNHPVIPFPGNPEL